MEVVVALHLQSEDDIEAILHDVEDEARDGGFEIANAESTSETGLAETEIVVNLLLNFIGSVAATVALDGARALIGKLRKSHESVTGGIAELADEAVESASESHPD